MPELKRTTPCAQCPFRKASPPGYLGASSAEGFLGSTQAEYEMPCHVAIDYMQDDWLEEQYPNADLCVGSLQFLNNQLKRPRSDKLAAACDKVGRNDKIMDSPAEFMAHHDNDFNRKFVEHARLMEPDVQRDYSPFDDDDPRNHLNESHAAWIKGVAVPMTASIEVEVEE